MDPEAISETRKTIERLSIGLPVASRLVDDIVRKADAYELYRDLHRAAKEMYDAGIAAEKCLRAMKDGPVGEAFENYKAAFAVYAEKFDVMKSALAALDAAGVTAEEVSGE